MRPRHLESSSSPGPACLGPVDGSLLLCDWQLVEASRFSLMAQAGGVGPRKVLPLSIIVAPLFGTWNFSGTRL